MMRKTVTGSEAARRLLQAFEAPDTLDCDQAEAQLPAFVEAERAGEDVDAAPEFAALLRHLDHCEDCVELYEQLADDLEVLAGEAETLPQVPLTPPTFFTPARQSEHVILRVLRGLTRRFEMDVPALRFKPAVATLGSGKRITLLADTLSEVKGAPLVSLSLSGEPGAADVTVAIRDLAAGSRWQVQLIAGDNAWTATTDERGIAQFRGLALPEGQALTVHCAELAGA
jgi:predicted anti-sigma-YlaC factor YlaD